MKYRLLALMAFSLLAFSSSAQLSAGASLSLQDAKKIAGEAARYALQNHVPGYAIAIVDPGGNLIYLERVENTFPAATEVAQKKANTAALFRAPTSKLENAINGGRAALITVGHTFLQGGVPVIRDGKFLGAIGVSGSASAQQDEDIAMAGDKFALN